MSVCSLKDKVLPSGAVRPLPPLSLPGRQGLIFQSTHNPGWRSFPKRVGIRSDLNFVAFNRSGCDPRSAFNDLLLDMGPSVDANVFSVL